MIEIKNTKDIATAFAELEKDEIRVEIIELNSQSMKDLLAIEVDPPQTKKEFRAKVLHRIDLIVPSRALNPKSPDYASQQKRRKEIKMKHKKYVEKLQADLLLYPDAKDTDIVVPRSSVESKGLIETSEAGPSLWGALIVFNDSLPPLHIVFKGDEGQEVRGLLTKASQSIN